MDQVYDAFVANQQRMMDAHELLGRTSLAKQDFDMALLSWEDIGVFCFWGDEVLRGPKFIHLNPRGTGAKAGT